MYITAYLGQLTIGNIRCFGRPQTLSLGSERCPNYWTVILGNNATGKTTILQSLALYSEALKYNSVKQVDAILVYMLQNMRLETQKTTLDMRLVFGDLNLNDISPDQRFRSTPAVAFYIQDLEYTDSTLIKSVDLPSDHFLRQLGHGEFYENYMVFACYGSGRRLATLNDYISDWRESVGLFLDDYPLADPSDWLLRLDYSATKSGQPRAQVRHYAERVNEALIDLLPDVSDIRFVVGEAPKYQSRVEFCTPDGWLTIDKLSLGYRTLTTWMVDFARRLFEHYPDSDNPLAEPAVCLVDEIDLHLHPQWQRQVMQYLRDKFPRTQFIVTAHSPLVVQASASAGANIAVLRRTDDGVVIDQSLQAVRGWRIDQLLTSDLFGLATARPPEFDGLMARRKDLLTKPGLSDEERHELADLDAKLHSLPGGETPEEMDAMDIIKRAAARLKAGESAGS